MVIDPPLRKNHQAHPRLQICACFPESPESRDFTVPVNGYVDGIEKDSQYGIVLQLAFRHKMKTLFPQHTHDHNVQIRAVVCTINMFLSRGKWHFECVAKSDPGTNTRKTAVPHPQAVQQTVRSDTPGS